MTSTAEEEESILCLTGPYISPLHPFTHLESIYPPPSPFTSQIASASSRYSHIREVRRDGSCFYRGFLYALCERLLTPENACELERIKIFARGSLKDLESSGYDVDAIEMFWEAFVDLFDVMLPRCREGEGTVQGILGDEDPGGVCDCACWYLRVITGMGVKRNWGEFKGFVGEGYEDEHDFCRREVEPVRKECELVCGGGVFVVSPRARSFNKAFFFLFFFYYSFVFLL